ncbi:MAG: EFR1 family ferrodoxin [Bacillota bacterium]
MATRIYYFTATGNSLALARKMLVGLPDAELVSIPKAMRSGSFECDAEVVGFVYPLYYWGLPAIVREFATKIRLSKVEYAFSFITSGGPSPGFAAQQLNKLLAAQNVSVNAFHARSVANYIAMYNIASDSKREKILIAARKKALVVAAQVNNRLVQPPKAGVFGALIGLLVEPLLYNRWLKNVRLKDKRFCVDSGCVNCGLCARICPVDNIVMQDKPQWQNHCEECLACIHWCPTRAIQIGNKTRTRARYHNPDITINDMLAAK